MLKLDTATFLVTQDNPAGPITRLVDDGCDAHGPIADADGNVSKANAIAYIVGYALLAVFVGFFFLAL